MAVQFLTTCVDVRPRDVDLLEALVDGAREITWETFRRHVPVEEIQDMFPDYAWDGRGLHIKDDYSVSFYKGKWDDKTAYFLGHSAIEYIWVEV